jgi:hypothetical protein
LGGTVVGGALSLCGRSSYARAEATWAVVASSAVIVVDAPTVVVIVRRLRR